MGFKLLQSIGRSFQNVKLFISTKLFTKTKEGPAPSQKHDSMFSSPFFQFLQASNDDSTTTTTTTDHPAIYTIDAGKITITHAPMPAPRLHHLPLSILTRILRPLLVSPTPLILHPDAHTPPTYRTNLHPSILLTARLFHHLGTPLLYGANTLTTSTPYTSRSFDTHLLALRGPYRQLIKSIKLEIAWADELWAKFPLIARVVGEIVGLKKLEIVITEKGGGREGTRGEMMRRVEERCLEELVRGDLKALEELRLVGFGEGGFAGGLESLKQEACHKRTVKNPGKWLTKLKKEKTKVFQRLYGMTMGILTSASMPEDDRFSDARTGIKMLSRDTSGITFRRFYFSPEPLHRVGIPPLRLIVTP